MGEQGEKNANKVPFLLIHPNWPLRRLNLSTCNFTFSSAWLHKAAAPPVWGGIWSLYAAVQGTLEDTEILVTSSFPNPLWCRAATGALCGLPGTGQWCHIPADCQPPAQPSLWPTGFACWVGRPATGCLSSSSPHFRLCVWINVSNSGL